MKIILLFFFILPALAEAQIQVSKIGTDDTHIVGAVKPLGITYFDLTYRVSDGDTLCSLTYKNWKYAPLDDYRTIKFKNTNNTIDQLYSVIKTVFAPENRKNSKYQIELKLGDTNITISNYNSSYAEVWMSYGYFRIKENQLEKLFGRK